ncbi:MAG: inositol monophosphatase family protein, partial [Parerythrobacter sp.]
MAWTGGRARLWVADASPGHEDRSAGDLAATVKRDPAVSALSSRTPFGGPGRYGAGTVDRPVMTDHTGSTTGDRAGAGPADIAELGLVATVLADVARPVTLRHFRSARLNAEDKGGPDRPFDPVTVADRDAETAMRTALARLRPDDGIEGEEFPAVASTTGLIWSLDPIDGTRAYLAGAPTWGTLVAVGDRDGPLLGLIDQPWIGERFFGAPGEAWVEG